MTAFRISALVLGLVALGPLVGCGKKGPPLAPLLKVPVAAQDVAARREGAVANLQLRIPAANSDGTHPADVVRVEVYGFTGAAPAATDLAKDLVKYGTLVASVPVRKPPEEEGEEKGSPRKSARSKATAGSPEGETAARPPRPPSSMQNGFDQGELVVATEEIGPAQMNVVEPKPQKGRVAPIEPDPWRPVLQPPPGKDNRLYFVVGVNHKGQRGAFTPQLPVSLRRAPSPPESATIGYDEKSISLAWRAPGDLPRPIQPAAAEGMLASASRSYAATIGGYNVYEIGVTPQGAEPAAARVVAGSLAKAINAAPLTETAFTAPGVEFGKERCFVVRSVAQSGTEVVESDATPPRCVTPRDTFPPAPPKSVSAVASEGAVSLIWEANAESDLAGYLVFRAETGRPPQALTPEPIKETTFRDATAVRGVRYVYTVVAVDTAGNRSAASNGVEESAR